MNNKMIHDDELYDLLCGIINRERTNAENATDVEEQLKHAEACKKAVELRQNVEVPGKTANVTQQRWLDTPMSDKQFWHDVITVGASIVAAAIPVVTTIITARSQERIAQQHDEARYHQLALLMGYERDNLLDKRQLDIVNSLNK